MENLLIVDPVAEYPQHLNLRDVHYFHGLHFTAKPEEYCWLIWTGETLQYEQIGLFLHEDGYEYEDTYTEEKTEVKGMIELQVSPYDNNEIWLKYFSVTEKFKGQGLSKVMIAVFVDEFKNRFPDKILSRSRPSAEGELKLKDNLTKALDEAGIKHKFSS